VDCKPYYVIILSLVCGGAALLSLLSLASMIRLNIGILPKGLIKLILFSWPLVHYNNNVPDCIFSTRI